MRRLRVAIALAGASPFLLVSAFAHAGPACSCGDGLPCAGELCDDGGTPPANGDGCDNDVTSDPPGNCTATACGNGVLTEDEWCDDGNTQGGDGCESDCGCRGFAFPQEKQWRCVSEVNGAFAGVLRVLDRDAKGCLRDASRNGGDFVACLAADEKGRAERARMRTVSTVAEACNDVEEVPDFAFTDAATVNQAADAHAIGAVVAAFGSPAAIADRRADRAGAACQREVLKRHGKLLLAAVAELNRAKEDALRGYSTVPTACTPRGLAKALDLALLDADPKSKLNRARSALQEGVERACRNAEVDPLFACEDAATVPALVACAEAGAVRAACESFAEADALDLACE